MVDQSISCPSCGTTIPLTRALRADIEASVKEEYEAKLAEARRLELDMSRKERELQRRAEDLERTVQRAVDKERARLVSEAEKRFAEEHRLKDAEKERQLSDMRRQIDELKRKAEQGSQQLQGEAGEAELEALLRAAFPMDDIVPVAQGVRGADLHQAVIDARGLRAGAILWECKNARHWSNGWVEKLKEDQRTLRAEAAVLVTASLPKGCSRFTFLDGVLVTDFASAVPIAAMLRAHLLQLSQTRSSAAANGGKLELLYRYLSGVEFRQRVEAIVDAFDRMRADLDQERRAAERQWARRAKQIEAVAFNMCGMYGDLQGLVPSLPSIARLELPGGGVEEDEQTPGLFDTRTLQ
jgi:hypothetical protein